MSDTDETTNVLVERLHVDDIEALVRETDAKSKAEAVRIAIFEYLEQRNIAIKTDIGTWGGSRR